MYKPLRYEGHESAFSEYFSTVKKQMQALNDKLDSPKRAEDTGVKNTQRFFSYSSSDEYANMPTARSESQLATRSESQPTARSESQPTARSESKPSEQPVKKKISPKLVPQGSPAKATGFFSIDQQESIRKTTTTSMNPVMMTSRAEIAQREAVLQKIEAMRPKPREESACTIS